MDGRLQVASRTITVGQAAEKSGLSPKAIRLYETRGLLAPTQRTEGGYRTYCQHDVALLRFIRQAKSLGLTLEEIKQIIDLERQGTQPCSTVLGLLEAHIEQIDQRIDELSCGSPPSLSHPEPFSPGTLSRAIARVIEPDRHGH